MFYKGRKPVPWMLWVDDTVGPPPARGWRSAASCSIALDIIRCHGMPVVFSISSEMTGKSAYGPEELARDMVHLHVVQEEFSFPDAFCLHVRGDGDVSGMLSYLIPYIANRTDFEDQYFRNLRRAWKDRLRGAPGYWEPQFLTDEGSLVMKIPTVADQVSAEREDGSEHLTPLQLIQAWRVPEHLGARMFDPKRGVRQRVSEGKQRRNQSLNSWPVR